MLSKYIVISSISNSIANKINSMDISIKIKFFLLKKIPINPIINNKIEVIK